MPYLSQFRSCWRKFLSYHKIISLTKWLHLWGKFAFVSPRNLIYCFVFIWTTAFTKEAREKTTQSLSMQFSPKWWLNWGKNMGNVLQIIYRSHICKKEVNLHKTKKIKRPKMHHTIVGTFNWNTWLLIKFPSMFSQTHQCWVKHTFQKM